MAKAGDLYVSCLCNKLSSQVTCCENVMQVVPETLEPSLQLAAAVLAQVSKFVIFNFVRTAC